MSEVSNLYARGDGGRGGKRGADCFPRVLCDIRRCGKLAPIREPGTGEVPRPLNHTERQEVVALLHRVTGECIYRVHTRACDPTAKGYIRVYTLKV